MLLDTPVLVDLLRDHAPAVAWFESLPENAPLAMSGIAHMELLRHEMNYAGSRAGNRPGEPRRSAAGTPQSRVGVRSLVTAFEGMPRFWPSERAQERAFARMVGMYPTHPISIPDFLIAFTAIEKELPLVTLDRDHQHFIEDGLEIITPYKGGGSTSRPERPIA